MGFKQYMATVIDPTKIFEMQWKTYLEVTHKFIKIISAPFTITTNAKHMRELKYPHNKQK